MKLSLTPRERQAVIVGGVLAVLVLWLYVGYIIGPLSRELGRLGKQIRSAKEEVRLLEAGTASETALRDQHRQVSESVQALRKLLPADSELSQLIERLSALASRSQVRIQTLYPQRELESEAAKGQEAEDRAAKAPDVYHAVLITIHAVAGYHQLGTFLSLAEAENKPMEIINLSVLPDSRELRRHQVKLILRAYFASHNGDSPPIGVAAPEPPGRS